jgi:predicted porin
MKKSLLAVAAIGAFASAAQAQSSVTVYGILDVGYIGTNLRMPAVSTAANGAVTTQAYKMNHSALGQSAETTSRLGFKGTEDLGGGMNAFFTAEFQLFPQDWSLSGSSASALQTGTSTNSAGGLQNRQTFVGLSKKGIGQAAVGTQYTPIHVAVGKTDPGQQNNMIGSVIYPANGSGFTTGAYTVRSNNALTAATDTFAGFKLSAMYAINNQDRTQLGAGGATASATNGGNTNQNGWGLGADYTWNKLFVTANYQSFKNETNSTTAALPAAATSNVNGQNVTDNQTYVGTTYDFGILKAYAGWTNRKVQSNLSSADYLKRSGQQMGVRSFITPKIEGWANVGNGRFTSYGSGAPTSNFTAYQLGANYWLSKRTNLYTIFGSTQTSSSTAAPYFPQGTAGGGNQYALGVRHTF